VERHLEIEILAINVEVLAGNSVLLLLVVEVYEVFEDGIALPGNFATQPHLVGCVMKGRKKD
jgi:hypothetical protein